MRIIKLIGITLVLASAEASAAALSYPSECVMFDVSPGNWSTANAMKSAECLKADGLRAFDDPLYAIKQRAGADIVANWVLKAGMKRYTSPKAHKALGAYIDSLKSTELTEQVQQGLASRYQTYAYHVAKATHNKTLTFDEVKSLKRAWSDLDAYLAKALGATKLDAEKELITRLRKEGSLTTDGLALLSILKTQDADKEELRHFLKDEFNILESNLTKVIEDKLNEMVKAATPAQLTPDEMRLSEGQKQLQAISEYSAFAQSIVQAGQLSGLMSPEEAARTSQIVQGVTQVAMAAEMLSSGAGYATLAGPYGLAFAGMLSLSGAFSSQQKSESAQIMSMLAAISKQIEDLQFSVDQGFANVSEQISQTEIRIMGRLGDILSSNAEINTKIDRFASELSMLRSEFLFSRRLDQKLKLKEVWEKTSFRDEQCLRDFSWLERELRDDCLNYYDTVFFEFVVKENAVLTGIGLPADIRQVPPEDRLDQVVEDLRTVGVAYPGEALYHRPTLSRLGGRIKTFLAFNKELVATTKGDALYKRVVNADIESKRLVGFFSDEETFKRLQSTYDTEYARILAQMAKRLQLHEQNRDFSQSDPVALREARDLNLPTSFRGWQVQYPTQTSSLYGQVKRYASTSYWPSTNGADSHISNKVASLSGLALDKDHGGTIYFQDVTRGNLWVHACNDQSGYPSFPLAREKLANLLGQDIARMTLASKGNVDICYTPNVREWNGNIGIGNTDAGIGTVRSRLEQYGIRPWNQICSSAPSYFLSVYAKYPEYARSSWEKCHHGHFHHVLVARTPQLLGFTYSLTLTMPGYQAPVNNFSTYVASTNNQLDKCFLPYNNIGQASKLGVLMPFLQAYPLPITAACAGVDDNLIQALSSINIDVRKFMEKETYPLIDPTSKLSYGQAFDELLLKGAGAYREGLISDLFSIDFTKLDMLAGLIATARYFRPVEVGVVDDVYPTSAELEKAARILMFDPESRSLSSVSVLERTERSAM